MVEKEEEEEEEKPDEGYQLRKSPRYSLLHLQHYCDCLYFLNGRFL